MPRSSPCTETSPWCGNSRARLTDTHLKKYLPYIVILLLSSLFTRAQDIHFSQFFETPLLRNPSLAGIFTGDYRVQTVYRDQWNSVTNAYKTTAINAEYK